MNIKEKIDSNAVSTDMFDLYQSVSDIGNSSAMQKIYKEVIVPQILEERSLKNIMQVPKLLKIVVNTGFNSSRKGDVEYIANAMKNICGQLPSVRKTKMSVSNFKIREHDSVGCMVTLRKTRMYNFLEKLLLVHLPRIQNFSGLSSKSFDGHGNFSFGIPKHSIFLEAKDYRSDFDFGFDITVVTSTSKDEDAKILLTMLGFPFKN